MKIILLQNVSNIGQKYDVKEVSNGYARNFLFPKKLAEIATDKAIKNIEVLKKAHDTEIKIQKDLLVKNIEDLSDVVIEMKEKANEKGHLFAGVHKDEIVEEIKKQTQLDIHPDFIQLKEPIKEIGEHDIVVEAEGKKNKFKLKIGKIE